MEAPPLPEPVDIEHSLRLARLWAVGKMIGGDEEAVFTDLVREIDRLRAKVEEAVKAERERCIAACEAQYEPHNDSYHDMAVQQCVNAIRATSIREGG